MPRGASPKRERQYEHIKDSYEKRGQGKRAEEIAARTVNKERAESGEAKNSRKSSSRSKSSHKPSASKSSSSRPSASKSSSSRPSASKSSSSRSSSSRSSKPSASRGSSGRAGSSGGRTREQLYQEARRKGVEGRSTMNKAQLERALSR